MYFLYSTCTYRCRLHFGIITTRILLSHNDDCRMADAPPPPKKPGSLRDRIAAFEKPNESSGKPAPPPLRPKPTGTISWKPKPPSPPAESSTTSFDAGASSGDVARSGAGGMSASDAKEAIGRAGGSLKDRMAALQGRGGFGAPSPPPKPIVGTGKKWVPPPKPAVEEEVVIPVIAPPKTPSVDDTEVETEKVVSPPAHAAPSEEEEGEEKVEPVGDEVEKEKEVDPEEEERQRRAAIAARMARLGGARVGMGPPVFGAKPPIKKRTSEDGQSVKSVDAVSVKSSESPSIPSATPAAVVASPPTSPPLPVQSPPLSIDASAPEPADVLPTDETEVDPAAIAPSVATPPNDEKTPAFSIPLPVSPPTVHSTTPPVAMPMPAAPRRAGPPRKKRLPSPPPAPESEVDAEPPVAVAAGELKTEGDDISNKKDAGTASVVESASLPAIVPPAPEDQSDRTELEQDVVPTPLAHVAPQLPAVIPEPAAPKPVVDELALDDLEAKVGSGDITSVRKEDFDEIGESEPEIEQQPELKTEVEAKPDIEDVASPKGIWLVGVPTPEEYRDPRPEHDSEPEPVGERDDEPEAEPVATPTQPIAPPTHAIASSTEPIASLSGPESPTKELVGSVSPTIPAATSDEPPSASAEPENEEDEEAVRKRRVMERMAKMGGVNPFAAQLANTQAPSRKTSEELDTKASPHVEEPESITQAPPVDNNAEEEDEEAARKRRVMERMAKMGGVNPFAAEMAAKRQSTQSSVKSVEDDRKDIESDPADLDTEYTSPPTKSESFERRRSIPIPPPPQSVPEEQSEDAEEEDEVEKDKSESLPLPPPPSRSPEYRRSIPAPPALVPAPADDEDEEEEETEEISPIPPPRPNFHNLRPIPPPPEEVPTEDGAPPLPPPPRSVPAPPALRAMEQDDDDEEADESWEEEAPPPPPPRATRPVPPPVSPPANDSEEEGDPVDVPPPLPQGRRVASEEDFVQLESPDIGAFEHISAPSRRSDRRSIPPPPPPADEAEADSDDDAAQADNSPDAPTMPHRIVTSGRFRSSTDGMLSPTSITFDQRVPAEILDEEEGDPIDPSFHSPSRRGSMVDLAGVAASQAASSSPEASPVREPETTAVETPAEDDEAARRRTIAERMAKLGGIRFGAAPPISAPRQRPSLPSEDATSETQAAEPQVPQDEEEEERARKERIAAKLAGMGGMRIGMVPFAAGLPPQQSRALNAATSPPPPPPARSPPPARAPPPPQPQDAGDSEHESLMTNSEDGVRVEAEESEIEEIGYEDVQEEEAPPPIPKRVPHHSSVSPTQTPTPTVPPGRPPIPTGIPPNRRSSTQSRKASTEVPPSLPPGRRASRAQEFVMVDAEAEETAPPPPPARPSSRLPPPRSAPPPAPVVHTPSDMSESMTASSAWELPSIPTTEAIDFGGGIDTTFAVEGSSGVPSPMIKSAHPQSSQQPPAVKHAEVHYTADELMAIWGRAGVHLCETATQLFEKSKKTLVGDGTYAGFVNAALRDTPNAATPIPPAPSWGYLVYSQSAGAVQKRLSDIMPGDIVALFDAKFKGHKGLATYSQTVGAGEPLVGIVSEFEGKKSKVRVFQANQHVGQQTVEAVSYRLEDLKSGLVKVYRVLPVEA
ncbi:Sh3 domain-containing protein [Mycena kentingensis (nom. inval.)]|nr:Sh3 domain-containing protein [Mycena kentingensis (nom. inval.)]